MRKAIPVSWKQEGYLKKFYVTYKNPHRPAPRLTDATGGVKAFDPDMTLNQGSATSSGSPWRKHILFSNDTKDMIITLRDASAVTTPHAAQPCHTFIHLVEGTLTSTDETGPNTFVKGDSFFIPKGTVCSWHIPDYARAFAAIVGATDDAF